MKYSILKLLLKAVFKKKIYTNGGRSTEHFTLNDTWKKTWKNNHLLSITCFSWYNHRL